MYKIYQVRAGETFETIAKQFKTTGPNLKKINGMDDKYELRVGQYIIVPVDNPQYFEMYIVKKGDTIFEVAKKFGVNYKDLLYLNGLDDADYIYPNQELLVPRKNVKFYITREGDVFNEAATKLEVTPAELLLQNATIYLLPGQLLVSKRENA